MSKYEYKFIEVPISETAKEQNTPFAICARVITKESQAGWRLKQILEPQMNVHGCAGFLVVMEKEVE